MTPLPTTEKNSAGVLQCVRESATVRARADLGSPVHQIIDAGFYLVDSGEPLNAFK